ncbi:hypothetical protein CALVIDRAFT_301816 [Calocera viscosa TUFC12733]|uniref:Uncharacterized protein n=1 Tax=Calocera viscosa (strain TUFC12733) TaxID=1330018 RepID=A0A167IK35_CALVF|nr:hypothetical protein CALVIDRAFT_301816 [Calocera viscosa TUFC12733]
MDSSLDHRTVQLSLAAHGLRSVQELFSRISPGRSIASTRDGKAGNSAHEERALELEILEELRRLNELRNGFLSSTARLPDDILRLVFLHCIKPWRIKQSQVREYRPESTTLKFSHVCRRWRIVTISTPSLWSQITLTLSLATTRSVVSEPGTIPAIVSDPSQSPELYKQALQIVGETYTSLLLHRTRQSMVSLTINLQQRFSPRTTSPSPLEPLTTIKDRITKLRVLLPMLWAHEVLGTTLSFTLCSLQHLEIISPDYSSFEACRSHLLWKIVGIPFQRLRHLIISCQAPPPYSGDALQTQLHCESLELRLHHLISGGVYRNIIAVLRCFPNLKKLGIGTAPEFGVHTQEEDNMEPIPLTRLRALSIEATCPELIPLLQVLRTASVEELHIVTLAFPGGTHGSTAVSPTWSQKMTLNGDECFQLLYSFVTRCTNLKHLRLVGIPAAVLPDVLVDQTELQTFACMAVRRTADAWDRLLGALLPAYRPNLVALRFYHAIGEEELHALQNWVQEPIRLTRIRSLEFSYLASRPESHSSLKLEESMAQVVDKLIIGGQRVWPNLKREACRSPDIMPTPFELSFGKDTYYYRERPGTSGDVEADTSDDDDDEESSGS